MIGQDKGKCHREVSQSNFPQFHYFLKKSESVQSEACTSGTSTQVQWCSASRLGALWCHLCLCRWDLNPDPAPVDTLLAGINLWVQTVQMACDKSISLYYHLISFFYLTYRIFKWNLIKSYEIQTRCLFFLLHFSHLALRNWYWLLGFTSH